MEFVSLCPFCGAEPKGPGFIEPSIYHRGTERYAICCLNTLCPIQPSVEDNSREDVLARWNTRSVTAATEVLMRTLKPEDRISACGTFCRYCGRDGVGCQCWNDD